MEERARNAIARRIVDAHFPKVKTLEEFEFEKAPSVPAALIRNLAEGGYLKRSEPVIFLGETGTGKTHLAIGLGGGRMPAEKTGSVHHGGNTDK